MSELSEARIELGFRQQRAQRVMARTGGPRPGDTDWTLADAIALTLEDTGLDAAELVAYAELQAEGIISGQPRDVTGEVTEITPLEGMGDYERLNALRALVLEGATSMAMLWNRRREPRAETPFGEVEKMFARLRDRVSELEDAAQEIEERTVALFNPPDDDGWSVLVSIEAAHAFIVRLTCKCVNTDPDGDTSTPYGENDQCDRCAVLGSYFDRPFSR